MCWCRPTHCFTVSPGHEPREVGTTCGSCAFLATSPSLWVPVAVCGWKGRCVGWEAAAALQAVMGKRHRNLIFLSLTKGGRRISSTLLRWRRPVGETPWQGAHSLWPMQPAPTVVSPVPPRVTHPTPFCVPSHSISRVTCPSPCHTSHPLRNARFQPFG